MTRLIKERPFSKQLCDMINRLLYTDKRFTQSGLAAACGIKSCSVNAWINGRSGIDLEHLPAICSYFGVTYEELLGAPSLNPGGEEERILLILFRRCSDQGRSLLLEQAQLFQKNFPREKIELQDIRVRRASGE